MTYRKGTYGKQIKEFIHNYILQFVQEYAENVIPRTHKLAKKKHSHISNGHHASSTIHNIHILLYKHYAPYLKLTTGHAETPAADSWGWITGTRFTTENASLRRAARLMNWDTFCTQWRKLIKIDIFDCDKKQAQGKEPDLSTMTMFQRFKVYNICTITTYVSSIVSQ